MESECENGVRVVSQYDSGVWVESEKVTVACGWSHTKLQWSVGGVRKSDNGGWVESHKVTVECGWSQRK